MNKRIAVLVAAVVPLAIVIAVVATRDDGSGRPAKLPVAAGGSGSPAAATAAEDAKAAPALYPNGGIVYQGGEGLPALDGQAAAYRLPAASVTDEKVRRLATALGLSGEPVNQDGSLTVQDGDRMLSVYPQSGGSWSYFRTDGGAGVAASDVATASPACPPDADCIEPDPGGGVIVEPPAPERPADLPTQDEAKAAALDLLRAAGVDVEGADVHVDDAYTQWSVRVDPLVDGMATSGLTTYLAIGSGGAIDYANGYLATPERVDEYPLTGTAVAIERMNRGEGFGGGVRPLAADAGGGTGAAAVGAAGAEPAIGPPTADDPVPVPSLATDTPGSVEPSPPLVQPEPVAPGEPSPNGPGDPYQPGPSPPVTIEPSPPDTIEPEPVEPQTITLTGAHQVLLFTPSIDGTEGWLVPAYAFTTGDGEGDGPVVMAVEGEFLQ